MADCDRDTEIEITLTWCDYLEPLIAVGTKYMHAFCDFPLIDVPISRLKLYESDQLAGCCAQCTTHCSGTSLLHCLNHSKPGNRVGSPTKGTRKCSHAANSGIWLLPPVATVRHQWSRKTKRKREERHCDDLSTAIDSNARLCVCVCHPWWVSFHPKVKIHHIHASCTHGELMVR